MKAASTVLEAASPCPIASVSSRVQLTSYTRPARPELAYAARKTHISIGNSESTALL